MSIIFEPNMIKNTTYDWFKNKLSPDFKIEDNGKSKVIFGFNGMGKTTIFKCISEMKNNKVAYLQYDDDNVQLSKGKKLLISVAINEIESINEKIKPLEEELNSYQLIKKSFGITNKKNLKKFGDKVIDAWDKKRFPGFAKVEKDIKDIETLLGNVKPRDFINNLSEISAVKDAKAELEEEKKRILFEAVSLIDQITLDDEEKCPVCDSLVPGIKQIIKEKLNNLNEKKSILIEKLNKVNITVDEALIDNLIKACKRFDDDLELRQDYLLCGGESINFNKFKTNLNKLNALKKQRNKLLNKAEESFNNIKKVSQSLKSDMQKYFKVSEDKIIFDDKNFTIQIEFSRNISTYSTGERNLISFLYRIYEFIGSDKTILLLDDPVSSLDLINHYKIAYEIVKNSLTKTLIILTHSVELLNAINSQYPNHFDFYYLEQINNIIDINKIPLIPPVNKPNIISLEKLTDIPNFAGFLDALKKRDKDLGNTNIQELFHFNNKKIHLDNDSSKFSNYDLLDLIENFSSFTHVNFYEDSYIKVLYLAALRVWLEKQLYECIIKTETSLINGFLAAETLNKKISCIWDRNGVIKKGIACPAGVTRDILMSKKVMLNQSIHIDSQVLPFGYAINLSFDTLAEEINELKLMFGRS